MPHPTEHPHSVRLIGSGAVANIELVFTQPGGLLCRMPVPFEQPITELRIERAGTVERPIFRVHVEVAGVGEAGQR